MPRLEVDYKRLPAHLHAGMKRYLEEGEMPGGFLTAALSNNFVDAMAQADAECTKSIHEICKWLYWECPAPAWGSLEKMRGWCKAIKDEKASITPETKG